MRRNLLVVSVYSSEANYLTLLRYHLPYRPQRSCGQGNIFTPVCHSFYSQGGGSASVHAGILPPSPRSRPPDADPPGADPPGADPPGADPPQSRPPWSRHPRDQTPPQSRPLRADPPRSRHPPRGDPPWEQTPPQEQTPSWEQTPLGADPPWEQTPPPPQEADSSIRSTSGRYASYWNAFLFLI